MGENRGELSEGGLCMHEAALLCHFHTTNATKILHNMRKDHSFLEGMYSIYIWYTAPGFLV